LKRNNAKFLDYRKDTHSRLRALKTMMEQLSEIEVKCLFKEYSLEVFYVFHEEFTNLELACKSKGHNKSSAKEELESLLVLLEKIFILLPDKIHARWQFNSIGLVLRKLLHCGNIIQIRDIGVRLFMLWLQLLQENADGVTMVTFASLVPNIPNVVNSTVKICFPNTDPDHCAPQIRVEHIVAAITGEGCSSSLASYNSSIENETEWCVAEECSPLITPEKSEKPAIDEETNKKFLQKILDFMTRRMLDIRWEHPCSKETSFFYLFESFKKYYLPHIFPNWQPNQDIFSDQEGTT